MNLPRPFLMTIREATDRQNKELAHLESVGIRPELFFAYNSSINGLYTHNNYEYDNPGSGFNIGAKLVSMTLSHQTLWQIAAYGDDDAITVIEDDAQFDPDWQPRFDSAMSIIPEDWDLLYIGSCCTEGRQRQHIGANLYFMRGTLCTHCYMVRKKAAAVMLESQQKIWAPVDIAMSMESHPKLNVYTIIPRLCGQFDMLLSP